MPTPAWIEMESYVQIARSEPESFMGVVIWRSLGSESVRAFMDWLNARHSETARACMVVGAMAQSLMRTRHILKIMIPGFRDLCGGGYFDDRVILVGDGTGLRHSICCSQARLLDWDSRLERVRKELDEAKRALESVNLMLQDAAKAEAEFKSLLTMEQSAAGPMGPPDPDPNPESE